MKNIKYLFVAGLSFALTAVDTQAALLSRANGTMIYDSDLDVTWVTDANLFKTQLASDPHLASTIINDIGTVSHNYNGIHTLSSSDFDTNTGAMTWWGAQGWVDNLTYGGVNDWRLPTTPISAIEGYNQTSGEMGHLFNGELANATDYGLLNNVQSSVYWSGSDSTSYPSAPWTFVVSDGGNGGQQFYMPVDLKGYALAVRDGDIAAVPLPGAAWLFGSGLLGLVRLKRRN